ncbi:hypothetical protein KUTeg_009894 [Tegillarca granosa]|uniref:SH3 domain-containing protein n=1 Tax=Tegillarca granosa TaxID=220873 RepID=A0ABQ9F8H0_TEGGR|nr:hypothetical protein KUTeg_009894 [Tegillarca granosa]
MELTRKHSYHGRFNPKDDFEFDFNDISRASTPMSSMSSRSEGRRREKTGHSIEDYKRKIARLKSELEMERAHSKQVHKEKSAEIKLLRNSFKRERQQIIDETKEKYQEEKSKEVEILQENIVKKKDLELQQVLRYKEEELKNMKEQFEKEKENLIKSVDENEKRDETAMKNLEEEIKRLKDEKLKIEDKFKKKCDEQTQKEKEFSRIKNDYDTELRRILSESKKVAMGNLQKLKKAEKDLSEACLSDDEISLSDFLPQYLDPHSQSSSRATSRAHSRAPSRSLAHLEDFKLEDIDIEKFLASATPSPFVPLNSTYVLEDNSTSASIPSRSPHLVSRAQSVNEVDHDDPSSEEVQIGIFCSLRSFELIKNVIEISIRTWKTKSIFIIKWNFKMKSNEKRITQPANRRLSEEKDRQLQKKVSELQAQTQRLERKVSLLKAENETLKRKQDEHKPLEDKIKTLKKRNAELAAIARRLEEKAKHLQQENMKKQKDDTGHQEADHLKKVFARQRAKDLAEHAKAMLTKDREIEELRKKCQELADQLSNADFLGPENAQMYGEKEELEIELTQKKIECETLYKEIEKEKTRNRELESDLQTSAAENTQLTVQVSDLTHRLLELEKVNEECNVLRLNLTEAQHECEVAKSERFTLQTKVENLNSVVKVQENAKEEYELALKSLQDRVIELQQRCHSQENRHRDLTKELETLRALATTNNNKKKNFHKQQSSSLNESSKLLNSNDSDHVVSTKSLDTGFADDDDVELDHSNEPSPDQPQVKGQANFEDPELSEISKKLKELEATDSEEDITPNYEDKGDDSGMESNREQKTKKENVITEEPGLSAQTKKGPIQVFVARYSYDPYHHSPNENPDAELPINAGDYDGFFEAELIDGRRGLVPSNFVDKVADEDLAEFHAAVAGANHHDDDSAAANSIQQDLDFDSCEETEKPESLIKVKKKKFEKELSPGDSDDLDLTDVIPYPRNLTLDRQLSTSIVISWKPPENVDNLEIKSYHVYIDGEFKTSIRGNDRTKALVEDVHRVSVRCVTSQGQSLDHHCTLLFGKGLVPNSDHTVTVTGRTDYIVLRCDDFRGFIPKQLMVRTLTSDNKESIDSESVKLPQSLIKEITADAAKTSATEVLRKSTELKQKSPVPKELPDTDDEIERAFQEAQDDRVSPRTKPSPKKVSHKSPVKMEAPTESQSPVRLKSPLRVVPAIEITRDSSTERGTSLDASDEEMDISGRLSGRSSQGKSSDRYQNESPRSKSQSPRMIDMKSDKDNRGTSPQTSKYVQDMDSRDGYREANQNVDKFNEHQNKNTMESPKKHKKDKDFSKQSHKNDEKTSDVNLNSKSDKSSRTSPRTITNSPKHKKGKYYNERDSNANDLKSSDSYNEHKSDMNISEIEPVDYEDTGDVDSISGEINPPVEDNRVRLFVALFDYDPVTMSPNEDAIDEELPFKEDFW